jgi:UDP-N-acetylmuramate: L-alanyl-gamma-D-glutamyl-meso-diaminopimelate ligase
MINRIHYIHFIGIGGTAMAAGAAIMKKKGYRITGSDGEIYPPMSTFLSQLNIPIFAGYSASNLDGNPDLVVIGNALSRGNEEVEAVLERKIPYVSLPELLREHFIRGKRSYIVTGTHGKTTTTAILSWIMKEAGWDPSFMAGGISIDFGAGFRMGKGNVVVLEGDEYDTAFFDKRPKFLHYLPDVILIHNIEFDHGDIYRDMDDLLLSFRRLVNIVPRNGKIMVNREDRFAMDVTKRAFCPVITYGLEIDAHWTGERLKIDREGISFRILRRGKPFGSFRSILLGEHNLRNLIAAVAIAGEEGISTDVIKMGVSKFRGIKRRLELIGEKGGITIYDDFAHHPTAIRATLKALREIFHQRTIWAIFEPRSNTMRRKIFQEELVDSFVLANKVIIAEVHRKDTLNIKERLDPAWVVKEIKKRWGCDAFYIPDVDSITSFVSSRAKEGDIVVIMSNGGFGGIQGKLMDALSIKEGER